MTHMNNPEAMAFKNNITDTALIFEGGGMRASYSAGLLNNLLEHRLYFDYVAGFSAGASCSVNYLTRDTQRAKRSFVDVVKDPKFGGWESFLKGEGYFRAEYVYEQTPYPEASLPLNFDAFKANPVYPDVMTVSNMEKDYQKLKESYQLGYEQGKRDVLKWKTFLEVE